jgi:hypothetical protein
MAAAGDGLNGERECEGGALSFTGRALSRRFELREVVIEAGGSLTYRAPTWAGAFVVVEEGGLLIACVNGDVVPFARGAVLTLDGLPVLELRAMDDRGVRLSLVRRCGDRGG